MTKKLVRSMMIGFSVFILVIAIAYFVCVTAYRMSGKEIQTAVPIEEAVTAESDEVISVKSDYYMVRCDGESLSVYSVVNNEEEFMYNLNVRLEDISDSELQRLKNGIMLNDRQALAAFEEDFTS